MKQIPWYILSGLIAISFWCAVLYESQTRKNYDHRPILAKMELLETKLVLERHKNDCFEEVIKMHMEVKE